MCRSVLKGYLHGWITLGVFWSVCTCSNSIYTTIPMPLYSYLVSPVSWNLEFILWWEFSLRRKQKSYALFSLRVFCDADEAFEFYCRCLQFFLNTSWDNAMLCSWYKKHLFLEAWLVLRVYRNSNGVKNYWGDFIPMLWKLLLSFISSFLPILFDVYITNDCIPACSQPLHFLFSYMTLFAIEISFNFAVTTLNPVAVFVFPTRQSAPSCGHLIRLSST